MEQASIDLDIYTEGAGQGPSMQGSSPPTPTLDPRDCLLQEALMAFCNTLFIADGSLGCLYSSPPTCVLHRAEEGPSPLVFSPPRSLLGLDRNRCSRINE